MWRRQQVELGALAFHGWLAYYIGVYTYLALVAVHMNILLIATIQTQWVHVDILGWEWKLCFEALHNVDILFHIALYPDGYFRPRSQKSLLLMLNYYILSVFR